VTAQQHIAFDVVDAQIGDRVLSCASLSERVRWQRAQRGVLLISVGLTVGLFLASAEVTVGASPDHSSC
jgi:uncharacterized protein (DUF2342 family)